VQLAGVELPSNAVTALRLEVEAALEEVNRQISHYRSDSEVAGFAAAPVGTPFKVSQGFAHVTRFALELHRRSGGAFDPTLGPLINLWGFGEKSERRAVPSAEQLAAARAATGARHLRITPADELIKDLPGLSLNLGGVGKGFGVDEMVRVLRKRGYTNCYASIAGDVRVLGTNAHGARWRIGISAPLELWRENDPMAAVAALSNQAISTSGDYQKFFLDADGRRLSHILEPRSGEPVQHNVGGVTVIAPDCMTADGLATTLFVLGSERGTAFIETWTNAAALFILRERNGTFRLARSSRFEQLQGR
jgi:thiamine biosynthesis lipoprotein